MSENERVFILLSTEEDEKKKKTIALLSEMGLRPLLTADGAEWNKKTFKLIEKDFSFYLNKRKETEIAALFERFMQIERLDCICMELKAKKMFLKMDIENRKALIFLAGVKSRASTYGEKDRQEVFEILNSLGFPEKVEEIKLIGLFSEKGERESLLRIYNSVKIKLEEELEKINIFLYERIGNIINM